MVKITFEVPKIMREVAQTHDIQEHPFDICFECPFRGDTCDGPNEQAMSMPRRIDWLKRLGKKNGITREKAAEMSGIPLATINSIMTGRTEDPRHSTMQALSKAYSGGCWGKYPCHFAALLINGELQDGAPDTLETSVRLEAAQREIAQLEQRLASAKEDDRQKVDYLKQEIAELKHSRRLCLFIILVLFLALISVIVLWLA